MSSISSYAASSGSNFLSGGSFTWSNIGNYTGAPDAAVAQSQSLGSGNTTQSLDAWGFAPSVPGGSTINGMQYVLSVKKTIATRAITISATALSVDGTGAGGGTAPAVTNPNGTTLSTTMSTITAGGSTDLWSSAAHLTVATVNGSGEGTEPTITFEFQGGGGSSGSAVGADAVQQTVFYSAAAAGNVFRQSTMTGLGVGGPFFANPIG